MVSWPPHLYFNRAASLGLTRETAASALAQASAVMHGCPPILTLGHLARQTGVGYTFLRNIVDRKCDPYKVFKIRKMSGGERTICVPHPDLSLVQRWINRHVLSSIAAHRSSFAYDGRSPLDCARQHSGARWLMKVDLSSFFESISEKAVYKVFADEIGYAPLVSFEMTRICTRVYAWGKQRRYRRTFRWRGSSGYSIHRDRRLRLGHLPQGAPTSPRLSNLVSRKMDEELTIHLAELGCCYTRYSDDMFVSTVDDIGRAQALAIVRAVKRIVEECGFRPNPSKTKIAPPGSRKVILGLVLTDDGPRLPREFRERILCELYHLRTKPVTEHVERVGFSSVTGYRNHLQGRIRYALSVEPEFGAKAMDEFQDVYCPL